jgi:hypothetical protein
VPTTLPFFIRGEFDGTALSADIKQAGDKAGLDFKAAFDRNVESIRGTIKSALDVPRNPAGALNLNADGIRDAARAEQARAASARELAAATRAAFASERDLDAQTRISLVAAEKLARQHEKSAAGLLQQAAAADRVQAELNKTASATGGLVTGFQNAEKGSGRLRQATVQVGQQFQDFAVQVQGGQSIAVAFTQQASQLGFVLSQLEGSTNKTAARFGQLGTLLAGPFGLPIIFAVAGAIALATEAFSDNAEAVKIAETGANGLATAQSALSGIFDQTSGSLQKQNELLLLNARLTALNLRSEGLAKAASSQKTLAAGATLSGISRFDLIASKLAGGRIGRADPVPLPARVLSQLQNGNVTGDQALKTIGSLPESAFKTTGATKQQVLQAIIDRTVSQVNAQAADLIDQSLNSGKLATELRKGGGGGGGKTSTVKKSGGGGSGGAKREVAELKDDLTGLIFQFDKAAEAAARFDKQLSDIDRLSRAGRITGDQAGAFTASARNALFAANDNLNREAEIAAGERVFAGYQRGLETVLIESGDAISSELEDRIAEAVDKALGKIDRDGFKALDGIAQTFGNGPASLLASLSKRSGSGNNINGFLNALGEGQREANERLADLLNDTLDKVLSRIPESLSKSLGGALAGAQTGGQIAGLGKSFGLKTSTLGGQLGGAAGSFLGPIGELAGSVFGSIVGGLFKKTPKGTVSISNTASSFSGSGKLRSGLTSTGDSVTDTLNSIAEQLGGSVGNFSTSIRQKKNSFFVGGQKFGSAQEASEAAILQQLQAGVINGIDAGAQRLLQSGKKIDDALKKAVSFQGALDRIKESTDPLGAALSKITREFSALRDTFTEAGASAEQFAGLSALETKERKAALDSITAGLRDLQRENSFGDTGRSLRDRQAAALAAFNPLEARVKAGDATAFTDIGRQLRDINREIFGSQSGYFEFLDRLQSTTNAAIAGQENIASINSTAAPIVSAVDKQTEILVGALRAMNDNNLTILTEISGKLSGGGGTSSIALPTKTNFA